MHLMYYEDAEGKRVYTLKVRARARAPRPRPPPRRAPPAVRARPAGRARGGLRPPGLPRAWAGGGSSSARGAHVRRCAPALRAHIAPPPRPARRLCASPLRASLRRPPPSRCAPAPRPRAAAAARSRRLPSAEAGARRQAHHLGAPRCAARWARRACLADPRASSRRRWAPPASPVARRADHRAARAGRAARRVPRAAARFSPDDKFSAQRYTCKKRFKLLPTQGPKPQF